MRKFLFLTSVIAMIAVTAMAVPAKRGTYKMLKLADGTEVKAQLVGDEHGHFWMTEDGKAYAAKGDAKIYKQVEKKTVIERAKARRAKVNAKRVQKRQFGHPTTILGQKKAIMLYLSVGIVACLMGIVFGIYGSWWAFGLPFIYLVLHVFTFLKMKRIWKGRELNKCLGETARNIFIYGLLVTIGILVS